MAVFYNQITGKSIERLAALSDGIFAVAMTLLVLDLHDPVRASIHSESDLQHALLAMMPQIVSYLLSFLTLGIFWNGQQAQLNHFSRSNLRLSWIHIAFLFAVSIMPFSTRLLAEYITFRTALIAYWANILLLGAILYASWRYARHAGLLKSDVTHEISCAMERRITIAQALYALGALLCWFSTYLSIAFIVLIQLNFAIAPRFRKTPVELEPQPPES
jgi:uncharacterized membrane protein